MNSNDQDLLGLAEKIISVLDEGHFTQTYKYATLLAIIDLVIAKPYHQTEPVALYMPEVAERVIELYLPQTLPFNNLGNKIQLLGQSSSGGESIVTKINAFRAKHNIIVYQTARSLSRNYQKDFEKLRQEVEHTLAKHPMLRLQNIGKSTRPFLYEVNWDENIKKTEVKNQSYNNRILLKPGVASALVRLAGLLRPLIQTHWTQRIGKINNIIEDRLDRFLFGEPRTTLTLLTPPLKSLQNNRCFYCDEKFAGSDSLKAEVDHFIPWARYHNNCLANLVAAHQKCNHQKRAHFGSLDHLGRWFNRPQDHLQSIAIAQKWDLDIPRSFGIARVLYESLPEFTPLWIGGKRFDELRVHKLPWVGVT